MRSPAPPKILYLVTEDWYFCLNRVPLARAARAAGAEVVVATRVEHHGPTIEAAGLRLVPLGWRRGGVHPWGELKALREIALVYRRERPDLIHHIALKPALHGSLAALFASRAPLVNTLTGLGAAFIGSSPRARLVGALARPLLRRLLNRERAWVIVQNPDDRALLVEHGLAPAARTVLVPGDGVDTRRFAPSPEPPEPAIAVYAGRMLWDKGLAELAEAARRLKARGAPVRIRLAGPLDTENPAGVPETVLREWQAEGRLEWVGPVSMAEMPALWAESHIAVLPSYREGLPNALLEAGASARALVATDVPGCREVVRHEETGLLVPPRDAAALAEA
ncbi:MAG: glycosyltransferase family 4 protein, partial [Rhodospirillaceae bacterium]|nr:glycosyltransferase family 4 protein [Rhodospirillaceae bacterium]